ncbi:MAG: hypothetical protein MJZ61_10435 [Bacteroidales bacterium]|nr:hypothetical protein [Bacteroidales bacterium]
MTSTQRSKCASIIHTCAATVAVVNVIPVPGVGAAADVATLATMAVKLAGVFGKSITTSMAKALATAALGRQAAKIVVKEILKFIPFLGWLAAPAISAGTLEASGWTIANSMASGNFYSLA